MHTICSLIFNLAQWRINMTKDLFGGFIQKSVANVGKGLERWVESFDPFRFSKRYKEIFLQRCSKIKILGMTRPIDISMIFVDLIAHQDIPSRLYVDHDALDKFFQTKQSAAEFPLETNRIEAVDFINSNPHSLILGNPGSGKTTFLKYIGTSIVRNAKPMSALPIYVILKEFSDSKHKTIFNYIVDDFISYCDFPKTTAESFLRRMLSRGHAIVLLDGLDEVEPNLRPEIVAEIENFHSSNFKSRIIISCRIADYQGWFKNLVEVELAPFSITQAKEFISKWFINNKERSDMLIEHLSIYPHLRELCSNPLMAALTCILYEYNLSLPENRTELYNECIDALLYRWDANRLIARQSGYSELSASRKRSMFAYIGNSFMVEGRVSFF